MEHWEQEREKIIGLGQQSIRKSYYPILRSRLKELERFRQVLDHSVDGIIVASLFEGKILDANRAASRLLAIPLKELIGATYSEVLSHLLDDTILEFLRDDNRPALSGHLVASNKSDKKTFLELNLSRESLESDTVVVAIFRDVTSRVETEKRLQKALEEADKANQAKSNFLAVVSHEMRTPLNPILGFSEILRESLNGTPEAEYLDYIIEAANRQLELVDDILSFTALDRGSMNSDRSEFNLYELCFYSLEAFQASATRLKLSLEFGSNLDPLPQDLEVIGEKKMLSRILNNLLQNACKYTHDGSVKLIVEHSTSPEGSSFFQFEVIDTGIGISPEIQESIFEAFTQADSSNRRNYEGIGLGLAICKKLVDFMGGEIFCQNHSNGSRFCFRIPMQVANASLTSSLENPEVSPNQPASNPLNVLIVEDRPDNAHLLKTILKTHQIQNDVVINGSLAVEKCMDIEYDCILMDLSMPVMGGIEASQKIRGRGKNCETPIIAITADATQGIEDRCNKAGINAYLSKPIKSTELANLISALTTSSLSS